MCLETIPALNKTHKYCNITTFSSHFWEILKLKLNPLSFPIEQVKQPSASVNPVNQLSFKLGRMSLWINSTGFNIILPLVTQLLNPLTKLLNLVFLLGKIILPLNKWIINSISFLFCVTYLLVLADWGITLPNPNVSFIYSKTLISTLPCVITKTRSPLLLIIKDPSPSVNLINQLKNF